MASSTPVDSLKRELERPAWRFWVSPQPGDHFLALARSVTLAAMGEAAAGSPEAKAGAARDAVASVAVTLTFRHLLLYGSHPSERAVERWIEKLKGLSDTEVLDIGASEEAQVRFL